MAAACILIGLLVPTASWTAAWSDARVTAPLVMEPVGTITEHESAIKDPVQIVTGPDGAMWFINRGGASIARLSVAGELVDFDGHGLHATAIAAGSDGAIWFTTNANSIGRMSTEGVITEYTDASIRDPHAITAGPDGALWFTNYAGYSVGRVTTAGVVSSFTDPDIVLPTSITTGPDGALWFTHLNAIGRITTAGSVTSFPSTGDFQGPQYITAGPGGQLWFVVGSGSSIARITTAGVISGITGVQSPWHLTQGPDDAIWFTAYNGDRFGRIDENGTVSYIERPGVRGADITTGPDSALWFTGSFNFIGRMTTAGAFSFPAIGMSQLSDLSAGPDGAMWFTNSAANSIGRITPAGDISYFSDPGIYLPTSITTGPDGAMWFTNRNHSIGRITVGGAATVYTDQRINQPSSIVTGSDGALWFTNQISGPDSIGRITTSGQVTTFTVAGTADPSDIAAGSDGALWFTSYGAIGRITTAGSGSLYTDPSIDVPSGIVAGPDGAMWFTNLHSIGRINPAGSITSSATSGSEFPVGIASGPDGALWFTINSRGQGTVGRITTSGVQSRFGANLDRLRAMGSGSDGGLWFVLSGAEQIGRIQALGAPAPPRDARSYPGNGRAMVTWSPPTADGGSPVTTYIVTASPGGQQCVWTSGPFQCAVNGLTNGQPYTFAVTASSTRGESIPAVSNSASPDLDEYRPFGPFRVLDSRSASQIGPFNTPWGAGMTRDVAIAGPAVDALLLNITVTNATADSFLSISPGGEPAPNPPVSSLNWRAGETKANAVTARVGGNGMISIYNPGGNVDVIIDFVGAYIPFDGSLYNSVEPKRILDSRPASQVGPLSTPWTAGVTRNVTVADGSVVPADATAVVLNVTATNTTANSFLSIWHTGRPTPSPLVSSLNWRTGQTVPNAVTIPVGTNGQIAIFNPGGAVDVIIDVVGYYKPGTGQHFTPLAGARLLDSRPASQVGPLSTPWTAGVTRNVTVADGSVVPADATAVVLNVTATNTTANSFLSIWPAGQPIPSPLVSSLNWRTGQTVPNAVTAPVGTNGQIAIFNPGGAVDVVVDVSGYFS